MSISEEAMYVAKFGGDVLCILHKHLINHDVANQIMQEIVIELMESRIPRPEIRIAWEER